MGATSNVPLILGKLESARLLWFLNGIFASLAAILFFRTKETPRNFGFVALAVFLLFDGYNAERLALDLSYSLYYFTLSGVLSFVSGVFFLSKREMWKNFGVVSLAGYLIANGVATFNVYTVNANYNVNYTFLGISTFFGILAAIYLLLRK